MSRRKTKMLANGRSANPQGRFAKLGHDLIRSPAYRSLNPNARALLVEIISLHNGKNNGMLWLSEDDAAKMMGVSCPKVARKAFADLAGGGLIAMTKGSHFNVKTGTGRARCWRLTWEFDDANRRSPSNEWKGFKPEDTSAIRRMERGLVAVEKLRRARPENQITGGNSPYSPSPFTIETGNSPDTLSAFNGEMPFSGRVKQGDSPLHTAIAIGTRHRRVGWTPRSGNQTCPTALKIWEDNFGQVATAALPILMKNVGCSNSLSVRAG